MRIPEVRHRAARAAVRSVFYPAMVAAVMGAFLLLRADFPGEKLGLLTALLGFSCVAVVHVSERLFPYRAEWNRSRGDFASDLVFTNLLLPALAKAVELFLAWFFVSSVGAWFSEPLRAWWPHDWPLLAQAAAILVIAEFFFYWTHRWGHRVELLWRFHSIHHVVARVYWNNSGRFHPVDLVLNWMFYFAPLFLFGVSPEVTAAFLTLNAVTGLLEHANIDFDAGPLNRVFNTAQLHRWHHSTVVGESSTNFGKVLSVWDQVFGTYFRPRDRDVERVGVDTDPIPPESWRQMSYPFRRRQRPPEPQRPARARSS